jgi:putative peptidoglycan lipid II flippase
MPLPVISSTSPAVEPSPEWEPNTSPHSSVVFNAVVVAAAFVLSRVLGMVREMVIAARFGTSPDYDAYVAAFRIPDLLFLIVMSGAFGSAFIPVFGAMLSRGRAERAWRLASAILTYTLIILGVTSAIVLLCAGVLIREVVAPGLDPEQARLATNLTRLLLLSPLLLGLGAAFKGMLEAQERFALSAYVPAFYNLAIIFGAVALVPPFGVYGLAIGVIVGASLHAGLQAIGLWRGGMRIRPTLDRATEGLGTVGRLMAPRVLGQAAFQVNFIVMTNYASKLGASNVGALNYAFQLLMLPHGVLALSLSTVIFPLLARQYELSSMTEMKHTLQRSLTPLVFLTLPAAVGLFCLRQSIVQVLFEFGSFDERSTQLVAEALGYFALALLGLSVVEAITRAFYAMHDTRTPVIASVATIAVNIALSALLSPRLGHGGLALSFALTTTMEMLILLVVLQRRIGGWDRDAWFSFARSAVATAAFAPIAYWIGIRLADVTDPNAGRSIVGYVLFAYGLAAAGLVYLSIGYLLGAPEIYAFAKRVPVFGERLTGLIEARYVRR